MQESLTAPSTFAQLQPAIRKHLEQIGLEEPSDIQNLSIPRILAGKNLLIISPTGCYDYETEVLTKRGWKFFSEVRSDEEVLSMNPRTFVMSYVKAIGKIDKVHSGIMVHVEGKDIDFRVTDNHNMFVHHWHVTRNKKTGWYAHSDNHDFHSARDIDDDWKFKTDGVWNGKKQDFFELPPLPKNWANGYASERYAKPHKIQMNQWLTFFGWYIAEGCSRPMESKRYETTLCQSKQIKIMESAVRGIGFQNVSISGPPSHRHFSIANAQLSSYLSQFGLAYEKFVPDYIKQLTPNQIRLFLKAYHDGDGHMGRDGSSWIFRTTSKRLAGDTQELLLKIGISSSVRKLKRAPDSAMADGHIRKQKHLCYEVAGRRFSEHGIDYRTRSKPRFEQVKAERVYCLSLPRYHLLYVRRNGKALWCGNSGKTLAAVLPLLHFFLAARAVGETRGISILYVTPLRALNRDIMRRMTDIGRELGINIQVRHGDTPKSVRAMQARTPPDMLITTPETLQAILPGKRMKEHLKGVRWVVVDEVHELATDERGVQLTLALERLRRLVGREFQRVGLSATVGEEKKVAGFLAGADRLVEIVKSADKKAFDLKVDFVQPTPADQRNAEKFGLPAPTVARARRIGELIAENRSTLVFTNTREHAEAIGSQLHALAPSLLVRVHHGSLSREIREDVEKEFQSGAIRAVICTSSLELGIDIGRADFIVQYMSPRETAHLVQRIGRSGHTLYGTSRGMIIGSSADDILEAAVIAENARLGRLERTVVHDDALDILAHQVVGVALDLGHVNIREIYEIARRAYPYRKLTLSALTDLVSFMASVRIVRADGDIVSVRFPKGIHYYYENLSAITDVKRYNVFDFFRKRRIGTLDQAFVAKRCSKPGGGTVFIMHGQTWKVISIDEDRKSVEVEPTFPTLDAIPSWEGEMIPVSAETAQAVGRLRGRLASEPLLASVPAASPEAARKAEEVLRAHAASFPVPTDNRLLVEKFENCVVIHSCFGNLVNEALATALASVLAAKYGVNVITQVDAYRIALISTFKIVPEMVSGELAKFTPEDFETTLKESVEASELFAWRQWQVARRFGIVERRADYISRYAKVLVRAYKGTPLNRETHREIGIEKMDVCGAKDIILRIRSGELAVEISGGRLDACSPLAAPIIDKIIPHDLLRPATPSKTLVDVVRERLYNDTVRLVCTFCGNWDAVRVVGDLSDPVRCPRCHSTLIAATYMSNDRLASVVKKKRRGIPMAPDEEKVLREAVLSASLVQTHGKLAVVVMAGRGVGPATANRVLRKPTHTDDDLYVNVLKAEREYARTRLFWD